MCKFNNFCFCLSIRTGVAVAAIFTLVEVVIDVHRAIGFLISDPINATDAALALINAVCGLIILIGLVVGLKTNTAMCLLPWLWATLVIAIINIVQITRDLLKETTPAPFIKIALTICEVYLWFIVFSYHDELVYRNVQTASTKRNLDIANHSL